MSRVLLRDQRLGYVEFPPGDEDGRMVLELA
jgi:hypothetical protein